MNNAVKNIRYISLSLPKANLNIKLSALSFGFLLLALIAVASSAIGGVKIPLSNILTINLSEIEQSVLYNIRLPRIFIAAIVGGALAVSGACLQSLFRNPLADPSIIGISSGAALFVAIAIVLLGGLNSVLGIYGLSFFAFLGALLTAFVVFNITKISGNSSVTYILLAGIAINAIAASGTGFLAFISNDEQLRTLTFWTMGSFSGSMWNSGIVSASIIIPSVLLLYKYSRQLNLLLLGEDEAKYLGVDTESLKKRIIILVTLIVGASVAVSGIIGFVGLIVPHLLRLVYGSDNRFIVPAAAIFGAVLMLLSDSFARTVLIPTELPVGIITSLIGGPYFLFLLIKNRGGKLK
jgi:iron complex transport system permease protein